jgi:fructan beta-fructosidase
MPEIHLQKTGEKSVPVEQFKKQRTIIAFSKDKITLKANQKTTIDYANLNQSEVQLNAKNENLKLVFSNDIKDSLVINYDAKRKTFAIDRRHSGLVNFEKSFGEKIHHTNTSNIISETIHYQIIIDWSSIEIFLNDGVYSFTEQIFPNKPYTKLSIQSDENQKIKNLTINKIKGVW